MNGNLHLPVMTSFWFGSDLTWLERLCIQSYLDRGHRFVLYTAETLHGVPDGAEIRSASEVLWPPPFELQTDNRLSMAVFSDIFRLSLIQQMGFIWVDLDAYCVRPFDFETPYVFAISKWGDYPNGVLGLPQGSKTVEAMLRFVTSPNPTPPWRGRRLRRFNALRLRQGESWGIESLPWGCSGPKALTYFLKDTGEVVHAMPSDAFYPVAPENLWMLHSPQIPVEAIEREGVYSVHVYGDEKENMALNMGGLPRPGSYLEHLCERHGIDPREQVIPRLGWMKKDPTMAH